jgi:hypothetical protein
MFGIDETSINLSDYVRRRESLERCTPECLSLQIAINGEGVP